MEVCGLSKARPIVCNDSPAFQRRHTSARCATESSTYFPCVIDTTSEGKFISGGVASTYRMHPTYRELSDYRPVSCGRRNPIPVGAAPQAQPSGRTPDASSCYGDDEQMTE